MTTGFDADVLVYAAAPAHPLGRRVAVAFDVPPNVIVGMGSALLLAEVLAEPMRQNPESSEVAALTGLLSRLELLPVDTPASRFALDLAVKCGLKAECGGLAGRLRLVLNLGCCCPERALPQ